RNRRRARPPANFPSAPTRDAAPSRTRSQALARKRSPTNSPRSDAILERGVGKPSGSVFGKDQYSDDLLHGGRARLAASARPPARTTGSPCVTRARSTSSPVSVRRVGRKRCSSQVRPHSPFAVLG